MSNPSAEVISALLTPVLGDARAMLNRGLALINAAPNYRTPERELLLEVAGYYFRKRSQLLSSGPFDGLSFSGLWHFPTTHFIPISLDDPRSEGRHGRYEVYTVTVEAPSFEEAYAAALPLVPEGAKIFTYWEEPARAPEAQDLP